MPKSALHLEFVLDGEVDEVGVHEHVVRGAQRGVVLGRAHKGGKRASKGAPKNRSKERDSESKERNYCKSIWQKLIVDLGSSL